MRAPRTTMPASVSRLTSSAVPSSRLNMPEGLRLRCRLISEWVSVDVVLADVFDVAPHVVGELRALLAEKIGGRAPGGEGHVHEIGRAAHHAAGGARPVQHHLAAGFERLLGLRHVERAADRLAGRGRRKGHDLAQRRVVLHVVELGDRARPAGEPLVAGDVAHPLAAEPDLALLLPEGPSIYCCPVRAGMRVLPGAARRGC